MKNCSRPILQSKLLEFSKKAWNQGSFLQKGCFISNLSRKSPFPENCHSRLCQWHPAIQFPCLMTILSITVRTLEPELSPRGPAGGIRAPTCNLGGIPYVELRGGVSQTNPRSHQLTSWVYQVNINSLCSISPESHQNLPCFFWVPTYPPKSTLARFIKKKNDGTLPVFSKKSTHQIHLKSNLATIGTLDSSLAAPEGLEDIDRKIVWILSLLQWHPPPKADPSTREGVLSLGSQFGRFCWGV